MVAIALLLATGAARAAILSVGPGLPYATIGDAMVAATPGDTIEVAAGDYAENLIFDRDLAVIGVAGSATTSISAPSGAAVIVPGVAVTLQGFTLNPTSNRGIQVSAGADFTGSDLVVRGFFTYADEGSGLSGGFSVISLTDCIFDWNVTEVGYGGGAIHVNDSVVDLVRVSLFGNHSGGAGTVAFLNSDVVVEDCTFDTNAAEGGAGALYVQDTTLTLTGSTFEDNGAVDDGGALLAVRGEVTAEGNTFCSNRAGRHGGAVGLLGVTAGANAWSWNTFSDNDATGDGGAIWASSNRGPVLRDNTFVGNGAADGGHVRAVGSTPDLSNDLFAFAPSGGGISQDDLGGTRDYNLYWANTPADAQGALGAGDLGPASVFGDPLLAAWLDDYDCSNDDFALLPGSPAIDAGDPARVDGDGSVSDIGAHGPAPAGTGTGTGTGAGTGTGTGTSGTGTGTATGAGTGTGSPGPGHTGDGAREDGGCGCATGSGGAGWLGPGLIALGIRRRR